MCTGTFHPNNPTILDFIVSNGDSGSRWQVLFDMPQYVLGSSLLYFT